MSKFETATQLGEQSPLLIATEVPYPLREAGVRVSELNANGYVDFLRHAGFSCISESYGVGHNMFRRIGN